MTDVIAFQSRATGGEKRHDRIGQRRHHVSESVRFDRAGRLARGGLTGQSPRNLEPGTRENRTEGRTNQAVGPVSQRAIQFNLGRHSEQTRFERNGPGGPRDAAGWRQPDGRRVAAAKWGSGVVGEGRSGPHRLPDGVLDGGPSAGQWGKTLDVTSSCPADRVTPEGRAGPVPPRHVQPQRTGRWPRRPQKETVPEPVMSPMNSDTG
jgi:hypothetical protein